VDRRFPGYCICRYQGAAVNIRETPRPSERGGMSAFHSALYSCCIIVLSETSGIEPCDCISVFGKSTPIWSLRGRREGETLWNDCNWCPWFASSCDSWQRGRNMSQECVFAGRDLRELFEDSGLATSCFQSPWGQKQSGWSYLRQEVKSIIQMLVKYHQCRFTAKTQQFLF